MSFIQSALAFIVAIGLLVAVHEFGHFWVARKLGVKVLKFSIGFGTPLLSKKSAVDDTEYVVAAIPLGGYVKMLDEREGEVAAHELDRAFNRKPVGSRMAIVAAGPVFNFLLAVVLYAAMYMVGVTGMRPVIGSVTPGSIAAAAGVQANSEIRAIDGKPVRSWSEASLLMVDEALARGAIELELDAPGGVEQRVLRLDNVRELLDNGDLVGKLGIAPWRPTIDPRFGQLSVGGPADMAGIQTGDLVEEIDGMPVRTWNDLVSYVQAHPSVPLQFKINRAGQTLNVLVKTDRAELDGKVIGRIGSAPLVDQAQLDDMRVVVRYSPLEAVWEGANKTWDISVLTVKMMGKLVTGGVSPSNISGPLSIAEYAGLTAGIGVAAFLGFLALLSVSLGVLNLLPVPVLDGGHLLFYFIEWVKGSPLSEQTQAVGQRIGLVMLMCLMVFAFYNDITRLFS